MTKSFNVEKEIPLMEEFYSVQGEGYHSGRSAYFIRLAGCDVGCVWCDVKESWDASIHKLVSIEQISLNVKNSGTNFVVITGGEPAMYDLTFLTKALTEVGVEIALETSGAYAIKGTIDWICLSPKKFKPPIKDNFKKAHELKMIAFNNHDFKWALELEGFVQDNCKLFIQPEWDKRDEMLPKIIDFVKINPNWQISLQTHKILNVR